MTGAAKVSVSPPPPAAVDLRLLKPFTNPNPDHRPPSAPADQLQTPSFPPKLNLNLFQFVAQSLSSILPWLNKPRPPPPPRPRRRARHLDSEPGCAVPLFRPYVAKVPWHGGARAFLSQLFPRYGHYCGPNWSSGKDGGSPLWDRRPIDWLDFCCYCHDIGYDSHDQAELLKADLAFLNCLEKPKMATKGGAHLALLYRSMCITGLRHVLIPYRMQLVKMQSGWSWMDVFSSLVGDRESRHVVIPDVMKSRSSFLAMLSNLVSWRGNAYRQNSE